MKKFFTFSKLYILADIVLIFGITFLTFFDSYSKDVFNNSLTGILLYCGGSALVTVILFAVLKLYHMAYENFGLADCVRVAIGYSVPALTGLIVLLTVDGLHFETNHIIVWVLLSTTILFALTIIRALPREIKTLHRMIEKRKLGVRTMIIGAGDAAKIVIDDSRNNLKSKNNIVVLVDDDEKKIGSIYSNIKVVGPISNVSKIVEEHQIEEAIIAIADLTEERLHEIVDYLSACNVRIRRLPLLSEMSGPNDIKVVDVHIDELLNRDPIKLDNTEVNEMLTGKTVLVTGGGGSIGSELMRQIFKTHPKKLIVFDIYENCTYDIQQELVRKMRNENIKDIELIALIGSTYNETRVEQIIKKYKPDYIYHAAAYKHVPLMEDSPAEAIRTNVIGTYNVAKLADKYKVKKMVLVSTDKAVRPTNTMGATKRFAETIIQYFSEKSKNTAYAAVRFGNVLGSNGSVVP
ncbi:MAG: polysaccharide biosynthesis protein, partial [Bacilli bacterium]|nr:polysaccharide biosynthesis protein [Bacilli bacterium]